MANKLINVDVIIPYYKGFVDIVSFISVIKFQKKVRVVNTVIPITVSDEGSEEDEKMLEFCRANNISFFEVPENYFSHSLTRQRAIKKYCTSDIVIILSQDVILDNDYCFYNLVKDIHAKKCAYAFGKQIGPKRGIERYIREKNYPNKSYIVSKEDIPQMQIMSFFASDAFSAIDRNVFIELDGYNDIDVCINEDMLYSYFVLMGGYKKEYVADAVVEHYHVFSAKQLYERYYKIGLFYGQVKIFDQYKSNHSGFKLAMYVFWKALIHFDICALFNWPFNMGARFFGFRKGRKAQ